ncbi:MAG: hypothetical protein Q4P13_09655 [Psychrobacter sp.]|nr:hypothetical protein [Psychrobacter sp.]
MIVRSTSYLMAAILPLLLFHWFAPADIGQIDFWLLWLVAMIVVALPMIFAEIALAYRSGQTPSSGMQILTREADASVLWRSFSWLAALVAMLIAALAVSDASSGLQLALGDWGVAFSVPTFALSAGLMVIALMLSLLGAGTLPVGLILMIIGLALGLLGGLPHWQFAMTEVSLAEWGRAVALALVSVGAGTGIYWFAYYATFNRSIEATHHSDSPAQSRSAAGLHRSSKQVLPIWGLQLIAGLAALLLSGLSLPPLGKLFYLIGVLCVSAYLLYYAGEQVKVKFGLVMSLVLVLALSILMAALLPTAWLVILLVIISSVAALLLSVFAGWQMKISHLRKSLNFSNEAFYNLWRVAIRIAVPLAMILALVGWISEWLG